MKTEQAKNILRLILVGAILSVVILSGCGQKGDLYLPDENQEKKKKQ